jgi:hypothetical protein
MTPAYTSSTQQGSSHSNNSAYSRSFSGNNSFSHHAPNGGNIAMPTGRTPAYSSLGLTAPMRGADTPSDAASGQHAWLPSPASASGGLTAAYTQNHGPSVAPVYPPFFSIDLYISRTHTAHNTHAHTHAHSRTLARIQNMQVLVAYLQKHKSAAFVSNSSVLKPSFIRVIRVIRVIRD